MTMLNIDAFYTTLTSLTKNRCFYIAYSGGLDSHVLLYMMARLRHTYPDLKLNAIHIHHGLNTCADIWEQHCETICTDLKVDYQCRRLNLNPQHGESLEAVARQARYQAFSEILPAHSDLLLAHNQNDQAETVLLQLLRGAGPKGLSAMPHCKVFSVGHLIRPLLDFTRDEIQSYAEQNQLEWHEDSSNAETRFDRNYLRHRVIPVLSARWPAVAKNLSRSAQHCATTSNLLAQLAQQDLMQAITDQPHILAVPPLQALTADRQANALRYWIHSLGYPLPNTRKLQQLQQDLLYSREDAVPKIAWGEVVMQRYRQQLFLLPQVDTQSIDEVMTWNLVEPLLLPSNLGQLHAVQQLGTGLASVINQQPLSIRFRCGGERCRPVGHQHSYTLKKLFQNWGIPPWQRQRIPLLYCGDQLAAVIGYCICAEFSVSKQEQGWMINQVDRIP